VAELTDLADVAESVGAHARAFVATLGEVARGTSPDAAIPLLLLATSDLLAAGARLGAMTDVVPEERFEPDCGPDADMDALRLGLATALSGLDEYTEVVDPVLGEELGRASVSGDLASIASSLAQGLAHYDAGDRLEALWWWQFSYLSSWGERASSAVRMLQLVLGHLRLDVDDDVAAEAEYDALQA
jgi:hypothetical protein